MPNSLKKLRIFVASPSDVSNERAKLETVVNSLKPMADYLGFTLEVLTWHNVIPDAGRPQEVIFNELNPTEWDIFIGVLWHRSGTPSNAISPQTNKPFASGTEEEFVTAYNLWKQHGKPHIMMYRCVRPFPFDVDTDQLKQVNAFFKLIQDPKSDYRLLSQNFDTTESFESLLHDNLQRLLIEYSEQSRTHVVGNSVSSPADSIKVQNASVIEEEKKSIIEMPKLLTRYPLNQATANKSQELKKISLWGPRGSGKTTFQAMLYATALRSNTRWRIRPTDTKSADNIVKNIEMIRGGSFPKPTVPNREISIYRYEFWPENINTPDESRFETLADFLPLNTVSKDLLNQRAIIEYADISGEAYLMEPLDNPVWDHLASSDAIICLLDPMQANDHFDITFQLLQYLWLKQKDTGRLVQGLLPQYIALCFTKIDVPELKNYIDKPRELILEIEKKINLDIDKLLLQYISMLRIKYFTISAIGMNVIKQGITDFDPKNIQPIHVLEPLRWLFTNMDVSYLNKPLNED